MFSELGFVKPKRKATVIFVRSLSLLGVLADVMPRDDAGVVVSDGLGRIQSSLR